MTPDGGRFPVDEQTTSASALLYLTYARLMDFPTPELIEAASSGQIKRELAGLHRAAHLPVPTLSDCDCQDLEQAYISTFEVGAPESPAPLYETAYNKTDGEDRRSVLEELVRFYEFFELDPGERPVEQPDHLTVELEFMAVVAQMETTSAAPPGSPHSFQLAQRDFLQRHLRPFVTNILDRPVASAFYAGLLSGLDTLLEAENRRLEETCEASPQPPRRNSVFVELR